MPLSAKIPVSCRGSQPIITADLTCLECELGVLLVACMHSHKQQGERQFGNLHTRDIKAGAFNLFHEQCPLCANYQIPTSSISMMRPNIEVMCIVKFQYATSAMLALPYDHFLVSLLFLDVIGTVAGTAIPTSHFIF